MEVLGVQSGSELYTSFGTQERKKQAAPGIAHSSTGPDTVSFSKEALELAQASAEKKADAVAAEETASTSATDSAVTTDGKLRITEMRDEWGRRASELSAKNMQSLSDSLAGQLQAAFRKSGLPVNPPVEFQVVNGNIRAKGARGDLDAITELVNSDPSIKDTLESLAYVTEEMSSFVQQGHLEFARAYRASGNPDAVVARYAHLFSGMKAIPSASTIGFNGCVSMSWEGRAVSAKDFRNNPNWIEGA